MDPKEKEQDKNPENNSPKEDKAPEEKKAPDLPDEYTITGSDGHKYVLNKQQLEAVVKRGVDSVIQEFNKDKEEPEEDEEDAPKKNKEDKDPEWKKEMKELRNEVQDLKNFKSQAHRDRTNQQLEKLSKEFKLTSEDKDLAQDIGTLVLVKASQNPNKTLDQVYEEVVKRFDKNATKANNDYVKQKLKDAEETQSNKGGGAGGADEPKKMTWDDLVKGKVRKRAKERLKEGKRQLFK